MKAAARLVRGVRWYQRVISSRTPPSCRFTPSCSEYAVQALQKHGALRGSWLAVWRILRCQPLVRGGYDPVPEHFPSRPPSASRSFPPTDKPS